MRKNTALYEVAKTLKVNDVIMFCRLMNRPKEDKVYTARVAEVTIDEEKEVVSITYKPCQDVNSVQCGFGCTFITPSDNNVHAAQKYGWQSLEVIGTEFPRPLPKMPNLYKNPGYDLVNM